MNDYEQAKADALAFLESLGITTEIKSNGVAETPAESKEDKPWLHFRWNCVATRSTSPLWAGGAAQAEFPDYKTGIGHAKFKKIPAYNMPMGGSYAVQDYAKKGTIHLLKEKEARFAACKYLTPTPPDAADILGSYARDYVDAISAGSFEDWASNLGYDEDSRRAERIYQECIAQRKPLIALGLHPTEIEKLAEYAGQF